MFIGHFAVAFGAKRCAQRLQLAWLTAGVAWADLLWTIFLLWGWEHVRIARVTRSSRLSIPQMQRARP